MGDSTPPLIAVEHLSKRFANVRALDDVSLHFRAGEIHGIIGDNGAGKSTLMNLLAGMGAPTAGTIYWRGQAVTLAGRMNSVSSSTTGMLYELDVIAAVVIGGTRMRGGAGSVVGTLVGVLILGVIGNMLNLLQVSTYWQGLVKGLIIIAAVLLQRAERTE